MRGRPFAFLILSFCGLTAWSQVQTEYSTGVNTPALHITDNIDTVSMANGNLYVHIPLVSYPQRGKELALSYSLRYNAKYWARVGACNDPTDPNTCSYYWGHTNNPASPSSAGWAVVDDQQLLPLSLHFNAPRPGTTSAATYFPMEVETPDGAYHYGGTLQGTAYQISLDGSGILVPHGQESWRGNTTTPGAVDSHGILYSGTTGHLRDDPDGNFISQDPNGNTTDTVGRSIPAWVSTSDFSNCTGAQPTRSASSWTVPAFGGGTSTFKLCYASIPVSIPANVCGGADALQTQVTQLQSLVLPDGQAWTIEYAAVGEVSKITNPHGGILSYTWEMSTITPQTGGVTCSAWITRRAEDAHTGSGAQAWTYNWAQDTGQADVNTVQEPDGTQVSHVFTRGRETSVKTLTSNGTLLKQVDTVYVPDVSPENNYEWDADNEISTINVFPQSVTTTLADGLVSQITFAYCCSYNTYSYTNDGGPTVFNLEATSYGLPNDIRTYDFGIGRPGPLLREITTSFLWSSNSTYQSANLLQTPTTVSTFDGRGTLVAKTVTNYDETNSLSAANISTQHGSALQTALGHPSSVQRWQSTSSSPMSHTAWYDTGVPFTYTDPNGNLTTFSYAGQYAGALLTGSVNALNQTTQIGYDSSTGLQSSITDPNNQSTNFTFDNMWRVRSVSYPDGGQTTIKPNDGTTPFSFVSTRLSGTTASPGPSLVTTTVLDGFDRIAQTEASSDPTAPVFIDTTYDGMGRVHSVSNPYRSKGEVTYGLTTYLYDSLGRVVQASQPDGSTIQYCFDGVTGQGQPNCAAKVGAAVGSWMDLTDEAGHHSQRVTDALGRITAVDEPGNSGTPAIETSYSFDALGNVTGVVQHGQATEAGRTRSFKYDNLSRLVTATNPETGTICYGQQSGASCQGGYDPNGNLLVKTDANGNSVGYQYDALNRLTGKFYNGSQVAWLQYDSNNVCSGCQGLTPNSNGRLAFSRSTAQAGPYGLQDQYFGYDPMGRLKTLNEGAVSVFGTGLYTSSFSYDLAGHPTSTTYEDGTTAYSQYDAAGRLCVVDSTSGTGCTPSAGAYVKAISYWPNGSPSKYQFGNGVTENIALNNRLQTCEMNAFMPTNLGGSMFMDHQYLFAPGNTACQPAAGNNGNIYGIVDNTNPVQGSNNRSHWFSYDNLNRIASYTRGPSASGPATESYAIDSFGNMSPVVNGNPVRQFDPATNRISNLPCAAYYGIAAYDAAGNQLCDLDNNNALMRYGWDPEAHLLAITGSGANTPYVRYSYQANGDRTRKDLATGAWTEYEFNGGQVLSTHDQNDVWTDFIYANGQKIARTANQDWHIHLQGYAPNAQTWALYSLNGLPSNYLVHSGDHILLRQYQSATARGGVNVGATQNGSTTWTAWNERDQDGQIGNNDSVTGSWHQRSIDLSRLAGGTLTGLILSGDQNSSGNWTIDFADIALVSSSGTVLPLYNQQPGASLSLAWNNGMSNVQASTSATPEPGSSGNVHFFVADHLGSTSVELASGGWPVWQTEYTPFGQEIQNNNPTPPQLATGASTPFKFTGKERDQESGLDYFGARYYGSNMGRWMSPDWSNDPDAVPYASLENPQSLNLYAYVRNNPLSHNDPDGHHEDCSTSSSISTGSNGTIHVTVTLKCVEVADHFWQAPGAWLHNVRQTMDHNAIAHQPPPQKQSNDQALNDLTNVMMGLVPIGAPKSPGNLQKQVEKGQAPKSVDRVDKGRGPFEKDHIEFKSGDALNQDGTWKHGGRELTGEETDWVQKNGWNPPE